MKKLLDSYEASEILASVKQDVDEMAQVFAAVKINKGKTETSTDDSGTTVIGGSSEVIMSEETLAQITEKISAIRDKYTK